MLGSLFLHKIPPYFVFTSHLNHMSDLGGLQTGAQATRKAGLPCPALRKPTPEMADGPGGGVQAEPH